MTDLNAKERANYSGYAKSVSGFSVPNVSVRRNENGLYDVYVKIKTGGGSAFSILDDDQKLYQVRVFEGLETRKDALYLAEIARKDLFA